MIRPFSRAIHPILIGKENNRNSHLSGTEALARCKQQQLDKNVIVLKTKAKEK